MSAPALMALLVLGLCAATLTALVLWPLWQARTAAPGRPWALAAVPLVAVLVYALTGDPQAVSRAPTSSEHEARRETEALVAQLQATLQGDTPAGTAAAGAPEAWVWLAGLQAELQRFDEAEAAFGRALALRPDVPQWLADRADLYLMAHGATDGEAQRLVSRALALAPDHPKALAIAGGLAHDRGDAAEARRLWTLARAQVPDDSTFASELDRSLGAIAGATATAGGAGGAATAVSGSVQLAPALLAAAQRAGPQAAVFVVLRATGDGPRMPLAVRRHTVGDLPLPFQLDTLDAMAPGRTWTPGQRLELQAVLSPSGDARPQPGDLVSAPVELLAGAAPVTLLLDRPRP